MTNETYYDKRDLPPFLVPSRWVLEAADVSVSTVPP